MHLEIFEGESADPDKETAWYVRLVGGNQETIMTSEEYDTKSNAARSATDIAGVTGLDIILVNGEPGP